MLESFRIGFKYHKDAIEIIFIKGIVSFSIASWEKRNNDRENNFGETKGLEMTVVNVLPSQCERFELLISHAPPFSYITAHFKYNIVLLSD